MQSARNQDSELMVDSEALKETYTSGNGAARLRNTFGAKMLEPILNSRPSLQSSAGYKTTSDFPQKR